ncbi:male accessory gland serine protease inhibitor-like [Anastrepha ludens]|uniref:male accessory gland serine protease inhibitor-like n=1 Tax=Anastrepha ludens TaxID=28586 RepID=UPI0023B04E85|nr:male accessory gland serine protease inhibitor-like [Anastrepha ludens]
MAPLNIKFLILLSVLIAFSLSAYAQRCRPLANPTCGGQADPGRTGPGCVAGTRWSYNPNTRQCAAFTYQGCDGNTNRYCSRAACERNCVAGPRVIVG